MLAVDNGNSLLGTAAEVGSEDETVQSFILNIPMVNEFPSFVSLDQLVIEETPLPDILQRHSYFQNVSAGSGNTDLDLIYFVEFHIVLKKCSNPRRNFIRKIHSLYSSFFMVTLVV